MLNNKFIPLPDRIILNKMNELENKFINGQATINDLRTEFSKYYSMATDEDVKKFILMEYDGCELGAKRSVT